MATDSMISAITRKNTAAANSAMPVPPACALSFSSVLASLISLEIRLEMSRLASETSFPIVGSSSCTGSIAI
jgi:hypothetical protein